MTMIFLQRTGVSAAFKRLSCASNKKIGTPSSLSVLEFPWKSESRNSASMEKMAHQSRRFSSTILNQPVNKATNKAFIFKHSLDSRLSCKTLLMPASTHRPLSSSAQDSLDGYYHIEVSNGLEDDSMDDDGHLRVVYATKITVQGPDVDGILASMTVALAMKGCSLVSLHAAKSEDMGWREHNEEKEATTNLIKDVFYVVDRHTGQPFADEELYELAESLLDALSKPMAMLGGPSTSLKEPTSQSVSHLQKKLPTKPYPTRQEQITVISSTE